MIITGNSAFGGGGGIFINESSEGTSLSNVLIYNNTANKGGGIANGFGYPSSLSLSNVTIRENSALIGGGIYWEGTSIYFDSGNYCNIYSNTASSNLGSDLYFYLIYSSIINIRVDTFTALHPNDYFAYPIENLDFDISNYIIEQFDQNLYVSPTGSDDNSGFSAETPLLTPECQDDIGHFSTLI